ncbi:Gfo/Idh/MocA family oxidoreductase [Enterococcus sp.]|uniref:Gfo/Idh/MocA family oxidoreductase n=1 Tax=Enterococcus sp. TaxID=35783 RepID=UPI0029116174|nr:Gfo/Idh/MocA family oxidoreductase [Enterococcus sp.]MDU5336746.1 Gfo/Idh/MocA family oxidoreductase [Enterococcus sp.]
MLVIAYIGFGNSVCQYHLPYVEARKDRMKVKYIYRREEDRVGDLERESWYPEIQFTSMIEEVMQDTEVNLIVVNTPDQFHVAYTKMALECGKNVLTEKPFAMTSEEAKEVFALAKEKELLAMANQNRRFDADMRTVRKVIESGVLGELIEVESHYDYYRPGIAEHKGMGVLYGLAVHPVDQIIGEFGVPEKLVYDVRSIDNPGISDDYYDIDFFYPNGLKAIVKTSYYVKLDYPSFTVHGRKGSFLMPSLGHNSSKAKPNGPYPLPTEEYPEELWGTLSYLDEEGQEVDMKVPVEKGDYGLIYDNIAEVLAGKAEKIVKDEEVVAVLEIIEAAMNVAKEAKV